MWKIFSNRDDKNLSAEAKIWNKFIEMILYRDLQDLNGPRRVAALVFWYDAEVNSGGHSGFFECYSNIIPEQLVNALNEVGADCFAQNLQQAFDCGQNDFYADADNNFGKYSPDLTTILQKYVILHATEMGIT